MLFLSTRAAQQLGLLPADNVDWPDPAPVTGKRKGKALKGADLFADQCARYRLFPPVTELQFAESLGRKWRLDFAWPLYHVAVEIEGLSVRRLAGQLVVTGRHASIQGFKGDCEKYATAILLGWSVLRFEQSMVRSRYAIETTMRVLAARGWKANPLETQTDAPF